MAPSGVPLFDFRCNDCGHVFERLVRASADPSDVPECPQCGKARTERQLGAPARTATSGSGGSGGCVPRGGFT